MAIHALSAEARQNLSGPGLRVFFNIADDWRLKDGEARVLLGVPASTYRRWKKGPDSVTLDVNQIERLSLLLGIYKALQILLPREDSADGWVSRPNHHPLFAGRPPLERMLSGQVSDLFIVREHLDAERGGWA